MPSGQFLIAASRNFPGRIVEVVSAFCLTILFAEFFGQSNRRISPASLNSILENRSSFPHSRDKSCGDQNNSFAANF